MRFQNHLANAQRIMAPVLLSFVCCLFFPWALVHPLAASCRYAYLIFTAMIDPLQQSMDDELNTIPASIRGLPFPFAQLISIFFALYYAHQKLSYDTSNLHLFYLSLAYGVLNPFTLFCSPFKWVMMGFKLLSICLETLLALALLRKTGCSLQIHQHQSLSLYISRLTGCFCLSLWCARHLIALVSLEMFLFLQSPLALVIFTSMSVGHMYYEWSVLTNKIFGTSASPRTPKKSDCFLQSPELKKSLEKIGQKNPYTFFGADGTVNVEQVIELVIDLAETEYCSPK